MARHYTKVAAGDSVLIDLGGWGIVAWLDPQGRWYDVVYVKIDYKDGHAEPSLYPADMVVDGKLHKQAKAARIWRHEAK